MPATARCSRMRSCRPPIIRFELIAEQGINLLDSVFKFVSGTDQLLHRCDAPTATEDQQHIAGRDAP